MKQKGKRGDFGEADISFERDIIEKKRRERRTEADEKRKN